MLFIKIQVVGVASYIYETVKIIDTGLKVHIPYSSHQIPSVNGMSFKCQFTGDLKTSA